MSIIGTSEELLQKSRIDYMKLGATTLNQLSKAKSTKNQNLS